jgi:Fibronectin type III domain
MTTTYGAVSGNSRIRFEYTITHSSTTTSISVWAYLEMINGWSSSGTYPASWTGYWGSGSNTVTRNIGTNGSSLIKSGSYSIVRGTADQTASFQAKAQNYTGYPTATITLTVPEKQTVPPAPVIRSTSPDLITDTSMRVQFDSQGDGGSTITKWELQYAKVSSFSGAVTVTSSGTSTLTGLTSKTTYYLRARGVNALGAGPWSAVKSGTTAGVPGGVTSTVNTASLDYDSCQITYTVPSTGGSAITGYELQLSKSSTFSSILNTVSGSGMLFSMTWSSLSRVTTYYSRARVKNAYGWGPYTTVSFKTAGQLPSAPSDYTASDIASTTAYFTLPAVSDNGGLDLTGWQYKLNTVASDTGATTSAVSTEYIMPFLQGLTPGTTYYFKMLVRNSLGSSPYGPWVSFTTRTDVPTPPLSLAASLITETTATASWAVPADLLGSALWGYTLRLAQNTAFSKGLLEYTSDSDVLSQPLTGLLPGTTYYLQVNAISANGPGSRSSIVSFKTLGTAPTPQDVWLRVAGVWKGGNMWMRVSGVWKQITLWQRINGTWRKN